MQVEGEVDASQKGEIVSSDKASRVCSVDAYYYTAKDAAEFVGNTVACALGKTYYCEDCHERIPFQEVQAYRGPENQAVYYHKICFLLKNKRNMEQLLLAKGINDKVYLEDEHSIQEAITPAHHPKEIESYTPEFDFCSFTNFCLAYLLYGDEHKCSGCNKTIQWSDTQMVLEKGDEKFYFHTDCFDFRREIAKEYASRAFFPMDQNNKPVLKSDSKKRSFLKRFFCGSEDAHPMLNPPDHKRAHHGHSSGVNPESKKHKSGRQSPKLLKRMLCGSANNEGMIIQDEEKQMEGHSRGAIEPPKPRNGRESPKMLKRMFCGSANDGFMPIQEQEQSGACEDQNIKICNDMDTKARNYMEDDKLTKRIFCGSANNQFMPIQEPELPYAMQSSDALVHPKPKKEINVKSILDGNDKKKHTQEPSQVMKGEHTSTMLNSQERIDTMESRDSMDDRVDGSNRNGESKRRGSEKGTYTSRLLKRKSSGQKKANETRSASPLEVWEGDGPLSSEGIPEVIRVERKEVQDEARQSEKSRVVVEKNKESGAREQPKKKEKSSWSKFDSENHKKKVGPSEAEQKQDESCDVANKKQMKKNDSKKQNDSQKNKAGDEKNKKKQEKVKVVASKEEEIRVINSVSASGEFQGTEMENARKHKEKQETEDVQKNKKKENTEDKKKKGCENKNQAKDILKTTTPMFKRMFSRSQGAKQTKKQVEEPVKAEKAGKKTTKSASSANEKAGSESIPLKESKNQEPVPEKSSKEGENQEPKPEKSTKESRNQEPGPEKLSKESKNQEPIPEKSTKESKNQEPVPEKSTKESKNQEPIAEKLSKETKNQEPVAEKLSKESKNQEPEPEKSAPDSKNQEPVHEKSSEVGKDTFDSKKKKKKEKEKKHKIQSHKKKTREAGPPEKDLKVDELSVIKAPTTQFASKTRNSTPLKGRKQNEEKIQEEKLDCRDDCELKNGGTVEVSNKVAPNDRSALNDEAADRQDETSTLVTTASGDTALGLFLMKLFSKEPTCNHCKKTIPFGESPKIVPDGDSEVAYFHKECFETRMQSLKDWVKVYVASKQDDSQFTTAESEMYALKRTKLKTSPFIIDDEYVTKNEMEPSKSFHSGFAEFLSSKRETYGAASNANDTKSGFFW